MTTRYDIIGDIHGMHASLLQAITALGYEQDEDGHWSHPDGRVLVSVGDLIDRGPKPLDCLDTIHQMALSNCALMVLGNHEVNALQYEARHRRTGDWLREHSEKNRAQFAQTSIQIAHDATRWSRLKAFLHSAPTWLELGEGRRRLRVVHACWEHEDLSVSDLPQHLDSPLALERSADEQGEDVSWRAIECCLKGPEEEAPKPFKDKDGHRRTKRRVAWWNSYPEDAPVIAFGHYWFPWPDGTTPKDPTFLGPGQNAVCLDYSLGKKGRVAVLRWPERELLTFGYVEPDALA